MKEKLLIILTILQFIILVVLGGIRLYAISGTEIPFWDFQMISGAIFGIFYIIGILVEVFSVWRLYLILRK